MIRKIATPLVPLLLSGLLAACSGLDVDGMPGSQANGSAAFAGSADGTVGASRRAGLSGARVQDRHAAEFIGGSRRDLVAWLGQPDLELREGGRSLLQFRQGQCVMLAMVEDGDGVAAVEMSGVVRGADARCVNSPLPRVVTQ